MKIDIDFDEMINEAAKLEGGETRIETLTRARQQLEELQNSHEAVLKEVEELRSRNLKDQVALEELRRINGDIVSRITVNRPEPEMSPEKMASMFTYKG